MLQRVEATRSLELAAAAKSLGLACPTPQALPTLLMLLDRCGDDFEKALIENTNAGGDNASRGLALGMVLGAMHGECASLNGGFAQSRAPPGRVCGRPSLPRDLARMDSRPFFLLITVPPAAMAAN